MSDSPFVAEIAVMPYTFAPRGWATCSGQLMPISQNTALFSLLGTQYGGDGKTTFALPDLNGRVAIHHGQGPGLSERFIGETGGSPYVTLLSSEMPSHGHQLLAGASPATSASPVNAVLAPTEEELFHTATSGVPLRMLGPAGGSQPHLNLQPFQTLRFCIALQGIFPPRG